MRKISTFFYHIGQGFIGVFRNGIMTVASTLILVSCMLILGTFYVVIDNIDTNYKTTDDINLIKIYVPDSLGQKQIDKMKSAIDKIGHDLGNIESCKYFTKVQNLERYKETSKLGEDILSLFNAENNPLPNSFEIHFTSFANPNFDMDKVYQLQSRLLSIEYQAPDDSTRKLSQEDIKENISLYDKVNSVNNTLTIIGAGMMIILLIVSLFVIMNTIKLGLHARRNEIMFMRYCGATKNFIRTPFIIEGIIIGIISAGMAFGLQWYIYEYIIKEFFAGKSSSVVGDVGNVAILQLTPFNSYSSLLILIFLGLGLFAGIISSSLSIKKYLKV